MRQKRAKSYKKQMNVYHYTFKFREPYQIIVDDEIVTTCQKSSYDINKGLTRTIQAENKPMITQCCIQALYNAKNQDAINLAKTFERRRCNHREAIAPADCIQSVVDINGENRHRYVVATQDLDLRRKLRQVPGVPLVYMNRSVMVMEPLSDASAKYSEEWENKKLTGGLNDLKAGKIVEKSEEDGGEEGDGEDGAPAKKKRKGPPKGPNPLSVKKKKKGEPATGGSKEDGEKKNKRRRKHKKSGEKQGNGEEECENSGNDGEDRDDRHNENEERKVDAKEIMETPSTRENSVDNQHITDDEE
ncbi:hypothetical protein CORT_0A01430 [Candida orthopsilosis Co 90-125]|uniref:U three protein 23 n=1 Tax=Candida orthopsilosis (strain 90-125) TaxID=1136231 RepID=H8WVR2_CANO9|nr:hypothetical protein CORT_0A01430 [Candida orthopsilosis Co 90-125]CCG20535.1 hypothetical protein CORT_0A01430 [Candida orthopsilosis Co 90-125]